MKTNNTSPMANFSIATRLQTPVCKDTSTLEIHSIENVNNEPIGSEQSSIKISTSRDCRTITKTGQELFVQLLYHTRINKEETYFELSKAKSTHTMRAFQDGGSSCFEKNIGKERLYVQDRSERCVRGGADSPLFEKIFEVLKRRSSLSISFPSIWAKYSSPDLQQAYEICYRISTQGGHTADLLPGRHMYSAEEQRRYTEGYLTSIESSTIFGIYHKYTEKLSDTQSITRISMFQLQFQEDSNSGTATEDHEII
ncbi:hypothetical protein G6F37_003748 [Rhizopus arrhizus]|nr:hypothetical protein G6F38_004159 [Rhizopus arrhizus]KAG1160704.1 hypothetical protein G6F37_003748 [Rhizopus arrhizus]